MRKKLSSPPALAQKQPIWFTGLLFLLALAPLPFGANRPWASDLLGLLAGGLLALCVRDIYRNRAFWPLGGPWQQIAFSAGAIAAVLAWGFLQTVAWLPTPHPLWQQAAEILGQPVANSVSLTPDRFGESAIRILAYAAGFLLAFFGGRDAGRARIMLRTLAYIAVAYAFYGLLMQSSGANIVLWFKKWAYQDMLTSTFINKNSYATYAGMGLLCCVGMLWQQVSANPLRLSVMALERIGLRDLYLPLLCLIVFGALLLTGSRGGITSSFAACLIFILSVAINRGWRGKKWLFVFVPAAVFLIGFASFDAENFVDRIDPQTLQTDSLQRIDAYETILRALGDNPWQGYGLGSFESAFRLYRNFEIHEWFEHAHNDYLELAMELGIPATLLYLAAIASLIGCCIGGIARRRKNEVYAIIAVAASVLVGMHSLGDFSMEIPAVAVTYAALVGLGVAQSWSSKEISET